MALAADDFVKETSATTGTGTYDLAGAVTGFQTFVAGIGSGNTCWYHASDGTDWEVGIGTVTDAAPDTLARTTILSSSNADAAVDWAAGTKTISCTLPASIGLNKGLINVRVFTTTGSTWTVPAGGVSFIMVECVGGGGGGAGGGTAGGAGGGAGGYARRVIAAASITGSYAIVLGTGGVQGASGAAGTAGASTTFGAFMTACGGAAGATGALDGTPGGSGGLATSGDLNVQGGDGNYGAGFGVALSGATLGGIRKWGGRGGNSYFGGGGYGVVKGGTGGFQVGGAGRAFGSGGGGGAGGTGAVAGSGGPGVGGVVIVWEFR